jgi:hypothetical protein
VIIVGAGPVDVWQVMYGYILAVPAGFVAWLVTRIVAAELFFFPTPIGVGIFSVFHLPFALAALIVLGLPFTLAFLWVMRYFRIRSLTVLLLGGAVAPSVAIFLAKSLIGMFSNLTTGRSNNGASFVLSFDTIPAGMVTFYILYRMSLKPCFERENDR